ncbi:MAG: penicillin-binding protein 2 [Pseudomonadota bacterium]
MNRDLDRRKQFTRRAVILAGGQALLLSGLVARLYQLQVIDAEAYEVLAEENRINMRLLPPPRGLILDRFGNGVAVNRQNYRLVLVSEQTESVADTLDRLSAIVELTDRDISRVNRETSRKRDFVPVTVREDLTWSEVARVEVNAPELPGVMIEVGESRLYPYGDLAAHVTGYVGAVSEAELTGDPLLELPGFRTGKNGAERIFEPVLRGSAGTQHVEVNAYGRIIREIARQEGLPGNDLTLTIDIGLQAFAARRLQDEAGAVIVMDVTNGDVLALVSSPSFDPNVFTYGLSGDLWQTLLNDPKTPLINKAVAGQYPPGSTYKMMVALAGLQEGLIDPNQTVWCPGHYTLGNHRFHCWKRGGHGHMNMVDAIKRSCDVYFYETARKLGAERMAEMSNRFGLGEVSGIELPGEREGLIPTPAWKLAVMGESWQGGETLIAGIGQGYVLTTPLQLAVMAARLGNGQHKVVPRLARPAGGPSIPEFEPLGVDPFAMDLVREGMNRVVNDPQGGTAYRARIEDEGMTMAGKTGTAQVRRITAADRAANLSIEEIPWIERDHALFVAYAPVENPRYAIAVVVEHGGGGSRAAAPVARDILREAQRRQSARFQETPDADPVETPVVSPEL